MEVDDASRGYCSCEEMSHGNMGPVADEERLARVLSDLHFDKRGRLKPSAFAISHLKSSGLSLVRVDRINSEELDAVARDVMKSSPSTEPRGALVGAARLLRDAEFPEGVRALCVKDDPVIDDPNGARDNPAHAISVATHEISDADVMEIRGKIWKQFSPIYELNQVYSLEGD